MNCEFCDKEMQVADHDFCDICPECLDNNNYI